jgi:cytidylate kinase
VTLECGGQFIFRSFPNALHVRVIAPRDIRAHNIMQDNGVSFERAFQEMEEHDRRHVRFLRSSFRRPSDTPERYDLIINTEQYIINTRFISKLFRRRLINTFHEKILFHFFSNKQALRRPCCLWAFQAI